jgi:hypothetical protein
MTTEPTISEQAATVKWTYVSPSSFEAPLVWTGPYVECKLEHPQLEPTCLGDQFFPDSVPYETEAEARVFHWRSRLPDVVPSRSDWTGVVATTHELSPLTHDVSHEPTLFQTCDGDYELVVDGTIVGDSKTAFVAEYSPPSIQVQYVTGHGVELFIDGETHFVSVGSRDRRSLGEQTIQTQHGTDVPTTPELEIRYPGRRTLYHPSPGANYTLFPSFGLDVEALTRSISVPTAWGELDHDRLAEELGIDITSRPYPERILWQAFAFAAFDPNTASETVMTQFPSGEIAVQTDSL